MNSTSNMQFNYRNEDKNVGRSVGSLVWRWLWPFMPFIGFLVTQFMMIATNEGIYKIFLQPMFEMFLPPLFIFGLCVYGIRGLVYLYSVKRPQVTPDAVMHKTQDNFKDASKN